MDKYLVAAIFKFEVWQNKEYSEILLEEGNHKIRDTKIKRAIV